MYIIPILMNEDCSLTPQNAIYKGHIEDYDAQKICVTLNDLFKGQDVTYYTFSFEPVGMGKKYVSDNIYVDNSLNGDSPDISFSEGVISYPLRSYLTVSPSLKVQVRAYETDENGDVLTIIQSDVAMIDFKQSIVGEAIVPENTNALLSFGEIIRDALDNYVPDPEDFPDNSIQSSKLAEGCISEIKLEDECVTNAKLAAACVSNAKLATGCVTEGKMKDNCVTGRKIAVGSVTETKIADGSVTASKLAEEYIKADREILLDYLPELYAPVTRKIEADAEHINEFISCTNSDSYLSYGELVSSGANTSVSVVKIPVVFGKTYAIDIDFGEGKDFIENLGGSIYAFGNAGHNAAKIISLSAKTEEGYEVIGAKGLNHKRIDDQSNPGDFFINESSALGKVSAKITVDNSFFVKYSDSRDFTVNEQNYNEGDVVFLSFNLLYIVSPDTAITQENRNEIEDSVPIRLIPENCIKYEQELEKIENDCQNVINSINDLLHTVIGDIEEDE